MNVQDKVETQRPLFKTYKEKSTKTQHTLKYPLRPKSKKSNLVLQMVNTLNFLADYFLRLTCTKQNVYNCNFRRVDESKFSLLAMFITVSVQLVGGFRHGSLPPFPSSDKVEQVNGRHHPKHHLLQTCRAVCQVWRMKSERNVIKAVPNVNLQYKVVI